MAVALPGASHEVDVVPEISPKTNGCTLHVLGRRTHDTRVGGHGALSRKQELGTRVVGVVMFEGLGGKITNAVGVLRYFFCVGCLT